MDIYSSKFWRIVGLLLLFDLFLIEITLHPAPVADSSRQHWDFRINELRQVEATPRVRALNSDISISKDTGSAPQQPNWLDIYFPGQSVPPASAIWHVDLHHHSSNPADRSGKVL